MNRDRTARSKLQGIDGWLSVILFGLAAVQPIRFLLGAGGRLYDDPGLRWTYGAIGFARLELAEFGLAMLGVAGCWYLVYRLVRVRTWQTIRIAITGIWLLEAGAALARLAIVHLVAGTPFAMVVEARQSELVGAFLLPAALTLYFCFSHRVANTYVRDRQLDPGIFS